MRNNNILLAKGTILSLCLILSANIVSAQQPTGTNTYVTDNTAKVMANSSSEGGGMAYNLPAPTDEELAALKIKYASLYKTPKTAGEVQYPSLYPRNVLKPLKDDQIDAIVKALVKTMTFEEKLAMIADPGFGGNKVEKGQAMYLPGVPRLGVPVVRQHDGSAGVGSFYPTTNLPVENVLGNTFDLDLAAQYGSVIGKELVSIGSNYELGTQFDLVRDMRWARAKDTFGEDYYLTAEIATSETKGLQAQGAGAQAKHIGAYATNGDGQLWTFVDEQTLHTAYLFPFEQPVKRADLSEIMTTYTRLNGYYTASNKHLLKDILRDMWNFKGATVTDAMSTKEFTTVTGIDTEMGKKYNIEPYVLKYMDLGLFTMDDLDAAVDHLLHSFGYAGYLGLVKVDPSTGLAYADSRRSIKDDGSILYIMNGKDVEEGGDKTVIELVDSWKQDYESGLYAKDNDIALKVAEEGIVLLKNEGNVLPLTKENYTGNNKVILVGHGADNIVPGTGTERSYGFLNYMTTPYDALRAIAGKDANIKAYTLDDEFGSAIPTNVIYTSANGKSNGWNYNGAISSDEINYLTTYSANSRSFANKEDGNAFKNGTKNSWSGYLIAPATGEYTIAIETMGGSAEVKLSSLDNSILGQEREMRPGPFPGAPPSYGDAHDVSSMKASAQATQLPTDNFSKEGLVCGSLKANLKAGQAYKIEVSSTASSEIYDQQVKLAWITPGANKNLEESAVKAASEKGTTVIYFVRIGPQGHGVDITENDLCMYDSDLAVLKRLQDSCQKAGNKLVVITYNRSAFAFDGDWADKSDAILAAFYPGQAGQQALANILTGKTNPSGKLAVTLPSTRKETLLYYDENWDKNSNGKYDEGENYSDYLAWQRKGKGGENYAGIRGEFSAQYNEGLNFGYRWYDMTGIKPEYAFGHGLSYTSFEYSNFSASESKEKDQQFEVKVTVKNTGKVAGSEVVQIYADGAKNAPSHVQTTVKQLVGFGRTPILKPGESYTLTIQVSKRMLSYWDSEENLHTNPDGTKDKWILPSGERTLMLAKSSDKIVDKIKINVK